MPHLNVRSQDPCPQHSPHGSEGSDGSDSFWLRCCLCLGAPTRVRAEVLACSRRLLPLETQGILRFHVSLPRVCPRLIPGSRRRRPTPARRPSRPGRPRPSSASCHAFWQRVSSHRRARKPRNSTIHIHVSETIEAKQPFVHLVVSGRTRGHSVPSGSQLSTTSITFASFESEEEVASATSRSSQASSSAIVVSSKTCPYLLRAMKTTHLSVFRAPVAFCARS